MTTNLCEHEIHPVINEQMEDLEYLKTTQKEGRRVKLRSERKMRPIADKSSNTYWTVPLSRLQ